MPTTLADLPPGIVSELQELWPRLPWHGLRKAHGAFHHVLLLPPVAAIRVRTGPGHRAAVRREHSTAAALASAGFPVPAPLLEPLHTEQWSAMSVQHVQGRMRKPGSWTTDRVGILPLLQQWTATGDEHPELASALPTARAWCGGELWPAHVSRLTATDRVAHDAARRRVEAVLEHESRAEHSAVHGDFGAHNLMWGSTGGAMLIDTDHAAWADPAIDIAPLLGVYGRDSLAADLPGAMLDRAATHRRVLSLQVAVAADRRADRTLREHALANFVRRIHSGDPQW